MPYSLRRKPAGAFALKSQTIPSESPGIVVAIRSVNRIAM